MSDEAEQAMSTPQPPPEAILIQVVRNAARISIPVAAKGAGISPARWSQIETGREARGGEYRPVWAKPGTLAFMAKFLGIPPERLETEGCRPDAAAVLREILRKEQEGSPHDRPRFYDDPELDDVAETIWQKDSLEPLERRGLIELARRLRQDTRERRDPRSQRAAG